MKVVVLMAALLLACGECLCGSVQGRSWASKLAGAAMTSFVAKCQHRCHICLR